MKRGKAAGLAITVEHAVSSQPFYAPVNGPWWFNGSSQQIQDGNGGHL